ncbi:ATP-binding protein [Salinispora mooreana]|uniref:ATP-binding protein n=1 Tax=Salinispora mooreana TaxID=999545 RepID=UPI0004776E73|nr:helix-turn-helix domain-containing protein [Salinispora mooreana]
MNPEDDRSRWSGGRMGLPDLLRGHRLAAGLTQADLANRAGVGVRTVRDVERGRSSRPQRTTVELLATALGLAGAARSTFLAAARHMPTPRCPESESPLYLGPDSMVRPTALPPAPELIGRERDVAELVGMLTGEPAVRLVSLVGLAGVGKTALALSVAHTAAEHLPGGVAGVLTGEGTDVAELLATSAAVFGAARLPALATRLAGQPALLLVDAVERAPGPVAEALHQLATMVPSLCVLVTGRHPVGLRGERVRPVAPLETPPPDRDEAGPTALDRYPAVALFTARLALVRPNPPRTEELPALARLVRRLGGLPLAIELMAARGHLLDLNELLDRYGDRVLDLATVSGTAERPGWNAADPGPAQRSPAAVVETLRDAVATSYLLLTPQERAALRRLAIFGNRWSIKLAEEMLGIGAEPADPVLVVDPVVLLDRLRELGLLSILGVGSFRFRLLDAVREFAVEQAAGAGELTLARRHHARVMARLVAETAPYLVGADLTAAVHRLDDVGGDISSALAHAAVDEPVTALGLAAGLVRWWRFRGRDVAGRQWLRRLLADPRTADAVPVLRGWALLGVARLAAEHGAGAEELPAARAALAALQSAGDVAGELEARTVLGRLFTGTGDHDEARGQVEAVLTLATRHGRIRDMTVAQNNLAWHGIRVGDLATARRRLAAADRLAAQCGERRLRVLAMANLAEVTRLEGRYDIAVDQGRRTLAALTALGDPGHHRRVLGTVGLALAQADRVTEAAEVLAELRPGGPAAALSWMPADGICGLIEGTLALRRGDRELAAEWFAVAAEVGANSQDRRDLVEALVGLAASTAEPAVLDRLDAVCRVSGIRLLPPEVAALAAITRRP